MKKNTWQETMRNFLGLSSFVIVWMYRFMKKSIIISLLLIYRPNEIFKLFSLKKCIVNDVVRKSYLFACNCFPIKLFTPLLFLDVRSFQINSTGTGSKYVRYRTIIMKIWFLFEKKLSKYNLRYSTSTGTSICTRNSTGPDKSFCAHIFISQIPFLKKKNVDDIRDCGMSTYM